MVYSVSYITKYISSLFYSDSRLSALSISGEVSNITYHRSGHIYFTLKDSDAEIKAVMFRSNRAGLSFDMKNGDKVIVKGQIRVYEKGGSYQIYAASIEPEGEGELYKEYLRLKSELEGMGMFDKMYKQPIPKYIDTLGIVTAPTGAAIRDIIRIAKGRNPYIKILLYPALVQGEGAKESIATGIETLDRAGVDVIIVGRGGGSIEDLWAFNEELVAKAIFDCQTPIISAVGHETDTTIADFVADKRAATPTEAAVIAVYEYSTLIDELEYYKSKLENTMTYKIDIRKDEINQIQKRLFLLSPQKVLEQKRMRVVELEERLTMAIESSVNNRRLRLEVIAGKLEGLSPVKRLAQGYSFLRDSRGQPVLDASKLQAGDYINARLYKGSVEAQVVKTIGEKDGKEKA